MPKTRRKPLREMSSSERQEYIGNMEKHLGSFGSHEVHPKTGWKKADVQAGLERAKATHAHMSEVYPNDEHLMRKSKVAGGTPRDRLRRLHHQGRKSGQDSSILGQHGLAGGHAGFGR